MRNFFNQNAFKRILDANINRAKEGLRVCEEVARFILNSQSLTAEFKKIRHSLDVSIKNFPQASELIKERHTREDVGRNIHTGEFARRNIQDIFFANLQRVKESSRVLEEFSKLKSAKTALSFKRMRYKIYELEKKAIRSCKALRGNR